MNVGRDKQTPGCVDVDMLERERERERENNTLCLAHKISNAHNDIGTHSSSVVWHACQYSCLCLHTSSLHRVDKAHFRPKQLPACSGIFGTY